LGYYLFKISPNTETGTGSGYNALLSSSDIKPIPAPAPFVEKTDHYEGNPKAKNVFIEYGDMQCPACAAYSPILKEVVKEFPDTVFVFRYFPLVQIHKNSVESALSAEAAGAQGKYWEMHDILFAKQKDWENQSDPLDIFATYAQNIGVANIDQFKSDVTSKKHLDTIQKNYTESLALKLQGTPTFYFNGHQLQNQDLKGLKTQAAPYINK
jgi:protein-disulfide isomerase